MYGGLFGDLPSTKKSQQDEGSKKGAAPAASAAETKKKKPQQQSVVSSLGTAGTSMAFVPTALRQRKRPAATMNAQPRLAAAPPSVKSTVEPQKKTTLVVETASSKPQAELSVSEIVVHHVDKHENDGASSPLLMEEESDEFRALHESVAPKDMYDPLVPNDLLAYWERKAHEKQRLELEREARETLERQKRLREQLEQERQEIEATGDVKQIVQHRTERSMMGVAGGAGRGRGRGVSNLPAWLVQKQQQEDNLGGGGEAQQGSNDTGRTVLLSNLTAAGNVDDELAQEVQEECEETCGKVESVRVQDAAPPDQPEVHVYVTFEQKDHAQQAARLFHGRMFGQRQITAKLVNPNT